MNDPKKDQISDDSAVELSEDDLDQAAGGGDYKIDFPGVKYDKAGKVVMAGGSTMLKQTGKNMEVVNEDE